MITVNNQTIIRSVVESWKIQSKAVLVNGIKMLSTQR